MNTNEQKPQHKTQRNPAPKTTEKTNNIAKVRLREVPGSNLGRAPKYVTPLTGIPASV